MRSANAALDHDVVDPLLRHARHTPLEPPFLLLEVLSLGFCHDADTRPKLLLLGYLMPDHELTRELGAVELHHLRIIYQDFLRRLLVAAAAQLVHHNSS